MTTPWLLLPAVAASAALITSTTPLNDPDLPWHLEVGSAILRTHGLTDIGSDWSFTLHNHRWVTTQWLSEVLLSEINSVFGLRGLLFFRVVITILVIILLAKQLLRSKASIWGPVVLTLSILTAAPFLQVRPQLFSVPLLVWLSALAWKTLHEKRLPRIGLAAGVTFAWANLHGLWALAPATLTLLAICALVGRQPRAAVKLVAVATASAVAAGLTPAGPGLLVSPLSIASAAAGHLAEWQPTVPRDFSALTLDLVVLLFALSWARATSPVPIAEITYVVVLLGFSFLAYRNIGPAVLLLAPVLSHHLQSTFPWTSRVDSLAEKRGLLISVGLLGLLSIGTVTGRLAITDPLGPILPVRLAKQVAADGQPHRVLNDYNVGGTLIHWGGRGVQVAIDGRADYYGSRRITDLLELLALKPGWRKQLAEWNPDRALLRRDAPITDQLLANGWRRQGDENSFILLARK